jgi:ribosomal-protein-alanine acetyltransferase
LKIDKPCLQTKDKSIRIKATYLTSVDTLYEIEQKSFREEAFTRSQIAILLTNAKAISYAALVNGKIAGFIIALVENFRGESFGHIITIDVMPRHRRKGIGERLLDAVEVRLREKGVNECRLEVREDNIGALALYLKNGYTNEGRLEKYYGSSHGLYLRKKLISDCSAN